MAVQRAAISLFFFVFALGSSAFGDLFISKIERRIDLTSHILRVYSTIKVRNAGSGKASDFLLAFPDFQARCLAYISASANEGKGKMKAPAVDVPLRSVQLERVPSNLTFFSLSLPKDLESGESLTLDVLSVHTRLLEPFPREISQADVQLVLFQDSALYLSPYNVAVQSLSVTLPSRRVESYTRLPNSKLVDLEVKYGPYENAPPFSYNPIVIHFENNRPLTVAKLLVREIEISFWGSIQVTEHYDLIHGGAQLKGGFSRFEYQMLQTISGASSFRHLIARLPPRAHSIYYRDEIGNISTSHLWGDWRKTLLEVEPRYPMFGGWRTSFTIGYRLPLQDFLFKSDGWHLLNISFGCPMDEVLIDNLIIKVVLPEGSKEISVQVPFPANQRQEVKYSHLDITGRPVIEVQKSNVVPEHNVFFQAYFKFNKLWMLQKPVILIVGFFLLFVTSVIYTHTDLSISKSSPSYLAKLHWEEVQAAVGEVKITVNCCLGVHDMLEASLRELSRTGDIQACKAARRAADATLKEKAKELRHLAAYLQSSILATVIWQKVEELISKEKEMQEKLILNHATMVDCYEKKLSSREVQNRIAPHQQKLMVLRQEVEDLLDEIDDT